MKNLKLILIVPLTILFFGTVQSQGLVSYEHGGQDQIFSIDHQGAGAQGILGAFNGDDVMAIGVENNTDMVYGFGCAGGRALYRYNLNTNVKTTISSYSGRQIRAATFDNIGSNLFFIQKGAGSGQQPQLLYTANTTTGAFSLVGSTGVNVGSVSCYSSANTCFEGLAYDSDLNVIFGITRNRRLYQISPINGTAVQIGTVNNTVSTPTGLTYDPINSELWLVNSGTDLYEIDKTNANILQTVPAAGPISSLTTSLGYWNSTVVLDVEGGYLYGENRKDHNYLHWETLSEWNNYGFYVEKSSDGYVWEEIGFVLGNGTTQEESFYDFYDANVAEGVSYYRYRQEDYDGTSKYSNVVALSTNEQNQYGISSFLVEAGNLDIYLDFPKSVSNANVSLITLNGEIIATELFPAKGGLKKITFNDINLSSGMYLIQLTSELGVQSKKLIKY